MNLFDLTGKVALITGSTKGIGEAIAHRMAEHGAKVVVSSRKADACDKVAADINKERGAKVAVPIPCNINYKEQLQMLVDETHKQLGKIDILVCNAALNPAYGPMSKIADDAFDKILGANIRSNHWLAQMVLPDMIEKKDGAIIIVSSIGGYRGSPVIGTYCISKAADIQLARNLAHRERPEQHPRQLHRAGTGEDRLRARAVGHARSREALERRHAAAPPGRAGRHRRRRRVPRVEGRHRG